MRGEKLQLTGIQSPNYHFTIVPPVCYILQVIRINSYARCVLTISKHDKSEDTLTRVVLTYIRITSLCIVNN